jgi:hypothetical protein
VAGAEPVHALIRRWRDVKEQPKGRFIAESPED